MPDWRPYVRDHLPPLAVAPQREAEIVAEMALQLEQAYPDALARRASEPEARRQAEAQFARLNLREKYFALRLKGITSQANTSRPLGSGMGRPSSRAVSNHSAITVSALARASCRVTPSAAQPANSGTSAMNASSSLLQ